MHSLRAGGAAALYRAAGDVDLVARMGRWETRSISAYLRESREVARGHVRLLAQGGHTVRRATRGRISLMPVRTELGCFRYERP